MATSEDGFPIAPRRAIEHWQKKEIDGTALMRCLVSYPNWMVPVSDEAVSDMLQRNEPPRLMFNKDPQGVSRLFIFSDGDAYNEFRKNTGTSTEQHFLSTKGTWVFRLPLDEIDFIAIDTSSPHEIAYGGNLFERLKEMADAIEVEEALVALRAGSGSAEELLPLVGNYQRYSVAVHKSGEQYQIALAPDQNRRALAAVFTSDDAFDSYLAEGKQLYPEGEFLQMKVPGPKLFDQLLRMQLDGMAFNCCGPQKAVAFALQFAELVTKQ